MEIGTYFFHVGQILTIYQILLLFTKLSFRVEQLLFQNLLFLMINEEVWNTMYTMFIYTKFSGTPAFLTIDRFDIVDYIVVRSPAFAKFIFRLPPLSYVTNVYTLPFDTYVWYSCFLMVAVILFVLYIIIAWEWKDPHFSDETEDYAGQPPLRARIFDIFMMEVGAITQQGSNEEPRSVSGRIATFFTLLILMFLYNSYSANIVALLQSTTDSIRTVEDLLTSRIKLGVEDIVYNHYYLKVCSF